MKIILKYLILFCFSIFAFSVQAADKSEIKKIVIQDQMVKKMWDSLWVYNNEQRYYETFPLLFRIEKEAEKVGELRVLAHTLENIGTLYFFKGNLEEAKKYCQKSIDLYEELGQTENLAGIFACLSNIAQLEGNLKDAMQFSYQAKDLVKYTKDLNIHYTVFNDLGVLYSIKGQFDSSYHYQKRLLDIVDPMDTISLIQANINIAKSFKSMHDFDKAGKYIELSLIHI